MSTWVDSTQQILHLAQKLNFLQVLTHPDLSLEETMHAHEINDPKIDPKFDIQKGYTIAQMVQESKVKPAKALNLKEIKNMYAQVTKLQSLVLQTQPLPQTIYTLTYLYDDTLWLQSNFVAPLMESINTLGAYIHDIHKDSCNVKEDDLSFSTFSFKKSTKSHDQVYEMFLKAEKELQTLLKTQKTTEIQAEGKELLAFMRLRRALHALIKYLGKIYDNKFQSKILIQLKTVRKRLGQVETLVQKNGLKLQIPQGVFSNTIAKTLRCHFGPRDIKDISIQEALNEIRNALDQFDLFLPPPIHFNDYRNRLDILSYKPLNLWSKAYFKLNLFHRDSYLLNTVKMEEALSIDIKEWWGFSEDVKKDDKFQNLIRLSSASISQTLYRQCSRNSRWFWETSKAYDDFNIIIQMANEVDHRFNERKKECYLSSWFYNWALSIMVRQMLWGFEQDLYEPAEYPYVAYQLQTLLHTCLKNYIVFTNKQLDKDIVESVYDGSFGKNRKKKKQLSQLQKKFLADSLFVKGLHYYFRAFYRLLIVLGNRKLIVDPFQQQLELRVNNRFRIFKSVLFIKKITYQLYLKQLQIVKDQEEKIIEEASDVLKAAKTIFALFTQFQDGETFFRQREDAVILEKLSVKLSLVAFTLKIKQPKKFTVKREQTRFPQIQMQ